MPIFMDRHDVPGLTAMDVAEGHKQDLKIQHRYGCRALTYWFDEKRGTAFCLIEAPHKEAVEKMHDEAHGLIPKNIIEVDSQLVEAFLGRIEDPKPTDEPDFFKLIDPAFRIVMAIELKDAIVLRSQIGEKAVELLLTYKQIIQQTTERRDGKEVQYSDGIFVISFASVSKAVKCAIEIQDRFHEFNLQATDVHIQASIGVDAGEPVTDGDDLFGEVTQLAKWLCYIAPGGQVMLSSMVKDHYQKENLGVSLPENTIKALNPRQEQFLIQLMDVMEDAWNEEGFSVDTFGKQMGLSKSQLYRNMTSLTGHSPSRFIKEYRLNQAVKLIAKQRDNIARIAFETGFGTPSYFSKCFRRRFGVLPSDFANSVG